MMLAAAAPLLLLFSAQATPTPSLDDTFDWLDNYQDAIKEAKATGKPVFLEYRCEP